MNKRFTLQISAGVGPVEARRFVALLAETLIASGRDAGLKIVSVSTHGEDDAPGSVEIDVAGDAPLALADHLGTHALVARSPGRGRRSRKRWFVGVSVHVAPAAAARVPALRASDLEVTVARSGGPGGQHVNKTATAVRVVHRPSGVSVRAAGERSQHRNRKAAIDRLLAILGRRVAAEARNRTGALRLAHHRLERGAAVREWRLDPRGDRLRAG